MGSLLEFEHYLDHLCEALGHADRRVGFMDYCRGLMLPIERKSVEPLAAHMDPEHVCAKHQSLHHFVAMSEWPDEAVLDRVRQWVTPSLGLDEGSYWIVDDSGSPKHGKHSVGVARQYCGQLGKTENCQVAVTLSLSSRHGSVPIQWRLYLPREWADDPERRRKVGVPDDVTFATKPEIALEQMRQAKEAGVPAGIVLADAAYGDETAFRDGITQLGLPYVVGIRSATTVWAPGISPLPPKAWPGRGRKPKRLRCAPGHEPVSVKELAMELPLRSYRKVTWREGTHTGLSSRFAAVRVRPAHRDCQTGTLRPEEWLLIEWPQGEAEPARYWLSTLPANTPRKPLVFVAKMRWRIERDYRELKQEFGLAQYEGRGWRGFHHHATLCIAAYGFLTHQRLIPGGKKNAARPKTPALPASYLPRGGRQSTTACAGLDQNLASAHRSRNRTQASPLPVLWNRAA